jgi:hypothetical protein
MDDLVTKTDVPCISKQEMKKTHENQHSQATMYKNGKKVKTTRKKK